MKDIATDERLNEYQPYWAARAELLSKTGAHDEAHQAYEIAIGLERDPAVRTFLQKRQGALPRSSTGQSNRRQWMASTYASSCA